jgi:hypothetical protein
MLSVSHATVKGLGFWNYLVLSVLMLLDEMVCIEYERWLEMCVGKIVGIYSF